MGEPTVRTERASLREDSLHDQTTSNGIRSAPTARGGEAAYSQDTDEIIEELKALAENMLETSRNARRRASLAGKQNQRSYEALMNALNPATGAKSQPSVPSVSTPAVVASPDSPGLTSATTDAVAQPAEHRHHDPVELHPASRKSTSHPKTMSSSGSEGEDEDDAETVYDGVKTVVYFQAADPAAFEVVASSRWQPEPLRRASNGTCIPVDPEESSEADNGQAGTGAYQKGGRVVDRVPLYPFGGGVTEAQSRLLSTAFERAKQAMKAGNGTSSDSSSSSRIPIEISQTAFASRAHSDVEASASLREANFQPRSCFDFVVDIERGIIFNAAEARHARRQEFRRLVKEGRAPSTMMGTFNLRVIMDPFKTGFEEESAFPIVAGTVIADRYEIVNLLGKATFSRAVRCYDLCDPIYADEGEADEECGGELNSNGEGHGKTTKKRRKIRGYGQVCLKIITNRKDFFDQSLDEIRLLTLINHFSDPDDVHVIRLIDAFYYKEHTMLVTELLSDNLYEYSKYNREEEAEPYFTLPRLRRIARQVTEALAYVHSLNLIHADLKPENILFVSHRQCTVKVIDFGSSCFLSDHLSSYIQSRSYRAPEVILGCDYDGRIDVWSLGAILAELVTGDVLFSAETVPEMLARIVYVSGVPIPRRVLWEGRRTHEFVNKFGCIYEGVGPREGATQRDDDAAAAEEEEPQTYYVYHPLPHYRPRGGEEESSQGGRSPGRGAPSSPASDEAGTPENGPYRVLRAKLAAAGMTDPDFLSFLQDCLCLDHKLRSTTKQLLEHPFIANERL